MGCILREKAMTMAYPAYDSAEGALDNWIGYMASEHHELPQLQHQQVPVGAIEPVSVFEYSGSRPF